MTTRENWEAARAAEAKARNSGGDADEEKIIVVQGCNHLSRRQSKDLDLEELCNRAVITLNLDMASSVQGC